MPLQDIPLRAVAFFLSLSLFKRAYIGFVCLVAVLMALSGQPQMLWRLRGVAASPVAASGKVDSVTCSDHGHVYFSFQAEGASYSGANPLIDGINCPDVKVGSRLAVYYENGNPQNNYAFYPSDADASRVKSALIVGSLFVLAFIFLGPLFLAFVWTMFTRLTGNRPAKV